MNNLRNKVQLIGNLGQSPEIKTFEGGKKVANLSLATNEYYTDTNGDKITNTQWHSLVAWGKVADIIEKHLKKGDEIAVEGKIVYEKYETKEGVTMYATKIQVNEVLMLGSKN